MNVMCSFVVKGAYCRGSRLQIGKLLPVPTESLMMPGMAGEVRCDSWAHLLEKSRFEADSLHFSVVQMKKNERKENKGSLPSGIL